MDGVHVTSTSPEETGVAATAVLGARVSGLGWDQGAIALLVIATLMWLVLIAPVLREVWHYLKFLTRQRAQEQWADLLPTREVEQEVLDILDAQ